MDRFRRVRARSRPEVCVQRLGGRHGRREFRRGAAPALHGIPLVVRDSCASEVKETDIDRQTFQRIR